MYLGKKGGSLLSAIYSHTQTGDPFIAKLVQHILHVVSHPIRSILERWIFEGELQVCHFALCVDEISFLNALSFKSES